MISLEDFDSSCRVCLSKNTEMINLFDYGIDMLLSEMTSLTVDKNEGLPRQVCKMCKEQLRSFDKFIKEARASDVFLRDVLYRSSVKIETEPDMGEVNECGSEADVTRIATSDDSLFILVVSEEGDVSNSEVKVLTLDKVGADVRKLCDSFLQQQSQFKPLRNSSGESFNFKKFFLASHMGTCVNVFDVIVYSADMNGYICPVCEEECSQDSLQEHVNSHHVDHSVLMLALTPQPCPPFLSIYDILSKYAGELKIEDMNSLFLLPEFLSPAVVKDQSIFIMLDPLVCDYCDHETDSLQALCLHLAEAHGVELSCDGSLSIYHCPCCHAFHEDRSAHFQHLRSHLSSGCTFVRLSRAGLVVKPGPHFKDLFTSLDVLLPMLVEVESYTCDTCGEIFDNRQSIISHVKSHLQETCYVCEKCGKSLPNMKKYRSHFLSHMRSACRRLECDVCHKLFTSRAILNRHLVHHSSPTKQHVCKDCGKAFVYKSALMKHRRLHMTHKKTAGSELTCGICLKSFTDQALLERHISHHANPNILECDVCRLPLPNSSNYDRHMELHRNDNSATFDCDVCSLSFLTKDGLSSHQAHKRHLSGKPLECYVCKEKFLILAHLVKHAKQHPKYKLTECDICGKKLATPQSLIQHRSRHFKTSGILCPHCGKQFYEVGNFRRHQLVHKGIKPHMCKVKGCHKCFYTVFELNRHTKYHNNTRDFSCSFCSKRFHEASHLKVHMRTHTGERPYLCPHCKKGFITRTSCKHHIRLIHQGLGYDLIQTAISKNVILV